MKKFKVDCVGRALLKPALAIVMCVLVAACGGDEKAGTTVASSAAPGSTPVPTPGSTPGPALSPVPNKPAVPSDAARFLAQSSFGMSPAEIDRLMQIGYAAWIDQQMAQPPTYLLPFMNAANRPYEEDLLLYGWWHGALSSPDQLRQRVAFALSQIFVISTANTTVRGYQNLGVADYYDVLIKSAFGNYRTLLENVALHPMMGLYLSHMGNKKEDPIAGTHPDENFAREVMQLFSIGLYELNPDGTRKLADGRPIPTYGAADVEGLAKVFTGFNWYSPSGYFFAGNTYGFVLLEAQTRPMMAVAEFHSTSEKKFLGITIPPQATADPQGDLKIALDRLASHPNVAPFISLRLIQHLVIAIPRRNTSGEWPKRSTTRQATSGRLFVRC